MLILSSTGKNVDAHQSPTLFVGTLMYLNLKIVSSIVCYKDHSTSLFIKVFIVFSINAYIFHFTPSNYKFMLMILLLLLSLFKFLNDI